MLSQVHKGEHFIKYKDGDEGWEDLQQEKWRLAEPLTLKPQTSKPVEAAQSRSARGARNVSNRSPVYKEPDTPSKCPIKQWPGYPIVEAFDLANESWYRAKVCTTLATDMSESGRCSISTRVAVLLVCTILGSTLGATVTSWLCVTLSLGTTKT